jgi:hypothetical protein
MRACPSLPGSWAKSALPSWTRKQYAKIFMVRKILQNYTSVTVGEAGTVLRLNSDGDILYMKIVAFDEINNFVVQNFSI